MSWDDLERGWGARKRSEEGKKYFKKFYHRLNERLRKEVYGGIYIHVAHAINSNSRLKFYAAILKNSNLTSLKESNSNKVRVGTECATTRNV